MNKDCPILQYQQPKQFQLATAVRQDRMAEVQGIDCRFGKEQAALGILGGRIGLVR